MSTDATHNEPRSLPSANVPGPQKLRRRQLRVKLSSLKPYPKQGTFYGTSSDPKISALADDMQKNGQRQPVLVMGNGNRAGHPGGTIVDGHDRVAAAKLLAWTEIWVEVLDDLKDADASIVEATYLSIKLTRKHLDRLDQARVLRRLYEIEKGRAPGTLRPGEQRETRDRVGERIGMSGKNLERYWNVLRSPSEVQRAFQGGMIKLEHAARIGLLRHEKQQELVRRLHGVTDKKAIQTVVNQVIGVRMAGQHKKVADALSSFSRALQAGVRDLEGRLQEVRPRLVLAHAPVLKQTADLIESPLTLSDRNSESSESHAE